MIPKFPEFKKIELSDSAEIEALTNGFPPYSDYHFSSMWAWNTHEQLVISTLNDNLVVRFTDYVTNEPFFSFIGIKEVTSTIQQVMKYARSQSISPVLKLIPEVIITTPEFQQSIFFNYEEDKDNNDYILDTQKLSLMHGSKLHHKRKLLRHFLNENKPITKIEKLTHDLKQHQEILNFFDSWIKMRNKPLTEFTNEKRAFERMFLAADFISIEIIKVYIENKLIGFTIFEVCGNFSVSAFQKADISYRGISEHMYQSLGSYLIQKNCEYINIEQDLGIEGLRRAKKDYDPDYLKKYTISQK